MTEDSFPLVGELRVLHDPDHRLDRFVLLEQDHSITRQGLVTRFNEFSFTLLEFVAAWHRGDFAWSCRLASHLAGDLGVILRHRYDPNSARLGTKRMEPVLPLQIKHQLRNALQYCCGSTLYRGVLALCSLLQSTMQKICSIQRIWGLIGGCLS